MVAYALLTGFSGQEVTITALLRCPSCSSDRRPRGRLEGVLRAVLQSRKTVAKPKQPEEQRLLRISSLSELTKHVIAALNFVSVVAAIKIKQDAIKLDQGCSRCAFKTETTGYFDSGNVMVNLLTQNSSSRDFAQKKNFENRATDRLIIIIKQLLPSSKIREIEKMITDSSISKNRLQVKL
jgi:hypothetical protein